MMDASYDRKRYVRKPACVNCQTFLGRSYPRLRGVYARGLGDDQGASRDDVVEAVTIFEELASTARRIYGEFHPFAKLIQHDLERGREQLAAFDTA